MEKIGIREPLGTITEVTHIYMKHGMHYERCHDDIGLIVAADHEDVGLVTYYRATPEEWNALVDSEDVLELVFEHTPYYKED